MVPPLPANWWQAARPLGAWLMGLYADRAGRRAALTLSVAMMCAGSLVIALTPGFSIWIENNTITNNTNDGIFVARHSENSTFIRNLITDHLAVGGAGINLYTNNTHTINITII